MKLRHDIKTGWRFVGVVALAAALAQGCASGSRRAEEGPLPLAEVVGATSPANAPADAAATAPATSASLLPAPVTVEEILKADAVIEPQPHTGVPIEINAHVQEWIEYFASRDRARFRRFLDRGRYYQDLVLSILEEQGVPAEMYYVAMIESGYQTHATSHASAVGPWQFVRATGRELGLKSNREVDERRDIVRATHAAARYLKQMHDEFGSWYLALAAYNAGPGRIRGAIRRGGSRDFWVLHQNGALPRETMNYVPKFLAAVIIGRASEKYGFTGLQEARFPATQKVRVPAGVPLRAIARAAGMSLADARTLNPHLLKDATPRGSGTYAVWVPKDRVARLERTRGALASQALPPPRPARRISVAARALARSGTINARERSAAPIRVLHRVRHGETLVSIAQRYGVPVSRLRKLNSIRGDRVKRGQQLVITVRT